MLTSVSEAVMRKALLLFIGLLLVLGYIYQLPLSSETQDSGKLFLGIIAFHWGIIKTSTFHPNSLNYVQTQQVRNSLSK